jgi:hypothetical protein
MPDVHMLSSAETALAHVRWKGSVTYVTQSLPRPIHAINVASTECARSQWAALRGPKEQVPVSEECRQGPLMDPGLDSAVRAGRITKTHT